MACLGQSEFKPAYSSEEPDGRQSFAFISLHGDDDTTCWGGLSLGLKRRGCKRIDHQRMNRRFRGRPLKNGKNLKPHSFCLLFTVALHSADPNHRSPSQPAAPEVQFLCCLPSDAPAPSALDSRKMPSDSQCRNRPHLRHQSLASASGPQCPDCAPLRNVPHTGGFVPAWAPDE